MWNELSRKNVIVRESIRLGDFIDEVYLPREEVRVRHNTLRAYRRDIDLRIVPALGNMRLEDIVHGDIQRMLDSCTSYKVATNARDTLRRILGEAMQMSYIALNPAAQKYTFPKREVYPEDHNGVWLTSFEEIVFPA